ncbi:DNA primase [Candidatus Peregrinibacteria bacterium]|nr:DNA primase [Candidatus Peregrinibacteria bacterium]
MKGDIVVDIKNRLSIEDVVAPYVQLKRAGRSLKACCPFHQEKTPSFVVSPERQLAYCFGCNKGGDMFTFIQEIEGLDFKGSIEFLADKAGLDMAQYEMAAPVSKEIKNHKQTLYEINEECSKFYQDLLRSSKEGKKALQYLENRGFTASTIQEFQVGLSPDSFEETYEHLVQKNCSKEDLLELGLVIAKDTGGGRVYDRFRLRLMFPIWDSKGRVVGFGGRALKKGEQPKYLNSPESPIYHKSDVLYGFDKAKKSIREKDLVVVVEGYMDVMASRQAGTTNVVASSGTALTEAQIKLIKRFTPNVAFAFDTDSAGHDALRRAVELGQHYGLNMQVIQVPEGKDPDECIKQDPKLWEDAVENAPFYLDYYLHQVGEAYDCSTMEGKKQALQAFLPLLKQAGSLERDHFIKQLGFLLKTDPSFVYDEFNSLKKDPYAATRTHQGKVPTNFSQKPSDSEYFIGMLLQFPEQVRKEVLTIPGNMFEEPLKTVYKSIVSQYNAEACVDVRIILNDFSEEEQKKWEVAMLFAEMRNSDLSEEMITREMQAVGARHQKTDQQKLAQELMHKIRQAQESNDREAEAKLFQEYSSLISL